MSWVGPVGERSALLGSVRLFPCCVALRTKIENINGNCERGCKGKLILKKSKRLTGISSAQGYKIISKLKI